jgi:hypothetical protein
MDLYFLGEFMYNGVGCGELEHEPVDFYTQDPLKS